MKVLINMEDVLEFEFRYKDRKDEIFKNLLELSKISGVYLTVIDSERQEKKLNIRDDYSYSVDWHQKPVIDMLPETSGNCAMTTV